MNIEESISNSIDNCIEKTKIFFKIDNNMYRNINKAINGLLFINNIRYFYTISSNNNDNSINKLSNNIFNLNLQNYFNELNVWFLFPEKELCLLVPVCKLNKIEPAYLWNDSEMVNTPQKIVSQIWCPEIKQVINTSQIIILKTSISSIFI